MRRRSPLKGSWGSKEQMLNLQLDNNEILKGKLWSPCDTTLAEIFGGFLHLRALRKLRMIPKYLMTP